MTDTDLELNSQTRKDTQYLGKYLSFLLLKTEKLVSALYLTTELFPTEEPLRWRVRQCGVELMSFISDLNRSAARAPEQTFRMVLDKVTTLLSYLQVAHRSNYLSPMNFALLEKEFRAFSHFLEEQFAKVTSARNIDDLGPSFLSLAVVQQEEIKQEQQLLEKATHRDHKEEVAKLSSEQQAMQDRRVQAVVRPGVSPEMHKGHVLNNDASDVISGEVDSGGSGRKEQILSLIKNGAAYTIKDISTQITGISEKTIQRDLQALVAAGLLRRKGERRWSRYFRA